MKALFVFYAAGSLSAFFKSLLDGFLSHWGIYIILGSKLHLQLTPPHLFSQLVWGGLWALLFPLFKMQRIPLIRGALLLGLFPTLAECFYFMPRQGAGWLGTAWGVATPIVVLLLNTCWALVTVILGNRAAK